MSEKTPRKSYIEKRIEIKADIGGFSNVTASVCFGEDIEWTTADERRKKMRAINKELTMELYRDLDAFLKSTSLRQRCNIMTDAPKKTPWIEED